MGQRLVMTIRKNGEDICKLYYHWSAYTSSALKEAKKIIDVITTDKFETEISAEEKECKLLFLREFSLIPLAAAKRIFVFEYFVIWKILAEVLMEDVILLNSST